MRSPVDGRPYNLQVGQVYKINNIKAQSAINMGSADRMHFIVDYVPLDKESGASRELLI